MRQIFDVNGLMEELIPIFNDHYTEQEIMELIAFYESPTGQKVITETPLIMKKIMKTTIHYFGKRSQQGI